MVDQLVVARGQSAKLFEAVDRAFDEGALTVQTFAKHRRTPLVDATWNDREKVMFAGPLANPIGTISFVAGHHLGAQFWTTPRAMNGTTIHQRFEDRAFVNLTRGELHMQQASMPVDSQMNLGAQPTATFADGLVLPPFLGAPAEC